MKYFERKKGAANWILNLSTTAFLIFSGYAFPQGNSGGNGNAINAKLDRIEAKLDELLGPQVTATFCISQGRGLDLAAKWAVEAPVEWEGGAGWAEVLDAKVTWAPTHPTPIGLPTEAGIEIGGGLGRLVDICIDLPLDLNEADTARLAQMAIDINYYANDGDSGTDGKFQKRGGRLLQYADRRIPDVGAPIAFSSRVYTAAQVQPDAADDEFDRVEAAFDNLTSGGFSPSGEILGVFRDANVRELLSSFDGLPVNVRDSIDDPERIFDSLEEFKTQINELKCMDFGVTADLRNGRPGLDRLCNRLDALPDFDAVERLLSGELMDGIAELLQPLLQNTAGVQETADQTRNRFCGTDVGQRRLFDQYCGR
jgi:hypothetical protein